MKKIAVLLCAGESRRMGFDKLTTKLAGRTPIEWCVAALTEGGADQIVFAVSETTRGLCAALDTGVRKLVVTGGVERRDSVIAAVDAMDAAAEDLALIHDAARPLIRAEEVRCCFASAARTGSGVMAVPAADTLVRADGGFQVIERAGVWRMQTPQAFRFGLIRDAYRAGADGCTDDASVFARAGHTPSLVEGSAENFKLTLPDDWRVAQTLLLARTKPRYGTGYDTHRLTPGRTLWLGGEQIPYEKGLLGHSDADVLIHAVIDALLGAAAAGDIGRHFPDSCAKYEGISSRVLLKKTADILRERGFMPAAVDATVICERPKLAPYLPLMEQNIAADLGLSPGAVSVKATTTEGMHDEGRGLCITAQAIATVMPAAEKAALYNTKGTTKPK